MNTMREALLETKLKAEEELNEIKLTISRATQIKRAGRGWTDSKTWNDLQQRLRAQQQECQRIQAELAKNKIAYQQQERDRARVKTIDKRERFIRECERRLTPELYNEIWADVEGEVKLAELNAQAVEA